MLLQVIPGFFRRREPGDRQAVALAELLNDEPNVRLILDHHDLRSVLARTAELERSLARPGGGRCVDQWPSEYWLRGLRQAHTLWPSHLVAPRIDEGRGLMFGPLPAAALEEHVGALKDHVAAANRIPTDNDDRRIDGNHHQPAYGHR